MGGAIIDEIASKQPERTLDSSIRIEFFHQHDQQNAAQPPHQASTTESPLPNRVLPLV
ncbi:MAG: hypothetical protein ACJ0BN_04715 [Limisphaerales bacterium]